jgi:hypothetical protein
VHRAVGEKQRLAEPAHLQRQEFGRRLRRSLRRFPARVCAYAGSKRRIGWRSRRPTRRDSIDPRFVARGRLRLRAPCGGLVLSGRGGPARVKERQTCQACVCPRASEFMSVIPIVFIIRKKILFFLQISRYYNGLTTASL